MEKKDSESTNILQYIKGSKVVIENEISNIMTDEGIDININQFFMNSPDIRKIEKAISRCREKIKVEFDEEIKDELTNNIEGLKSILRIMKSDALRLAQTFIKLDSLSEKLNLAQDYFRIGEFSKADKLLCEVDLSENQLSLLIKLDYLESKTTYKPNNFE